VFCPCCGMALSVTPSNKRDKERLRLRRQLQVPGPSIYFGVLFREISEIIVSRVNYPYSLKSRWQA